MQDAYLGLGSNLGDREAMLRNAVKSLADLPHTDILEVSAMYETPPMGPQDQGAYKNMAACIRTRLEPMRLVESLQAIERELGRVSPGQRCRWGPREIDIDLLLYSDRIIDEPTLTVPHPGMHERWFVLKPLSDIAPHLEHPVLKRSVSKLLEQVQSPEAIL